MKIKGELAKIIKEHGPISCRPVPHFSYHLHESVDGFYEHALGEVSDYKDTCGLPQFEIDTTREKTGFCLRRGSRAGINARLHYGYYNVRKYEWQYKVARRIAKLIAKKMKADNKNLIQLGLRKTSPLREWFPDDSSPEGRCFHSEFQSAFRWEFGDSDINVNVTSDSAFFWTGGGYEVNRLFWAINDLESISDEIGAFAKPTA